MAPTEAKMMKRLIVALMFASPLAMADNVCERVFNSDGVLLRDPCGPEFVRPEWSSRTRESIKVIAHLAKQDMSYREGYYGVVQTYHPYPSDYWVAVKDHYEAVKSKTQGDLVEDFRKEVTAEHQSRQELERSRIQGQRDAARDYAYDKGMKEYAEREMSMDNLRDMEELERKKGYVEGKRANAYIEGTRKSGFSGSVTISGGSRTKQDSPSQPQSGGGKLPGGNKQ
jgi:hypothetical protein